MVEVFKTDVQEVGHANLLVRTIHTLFPHYKANFDLDDCDRILRVKSSSGSVDPTPLLMLLKELGFQAEVLADDIYSQQGVSNISMLAAP